MTQIARFSILLSVLFLVGISHAEPLTYKAILKDAFANAHQLRQARLESEIKKKIADETQYGLWPDLKLNFNTEYVENLTDDAEITTVGGDVYSDRSTYQNSVYLDFTYTLIDYGEARKLLSIAKIDAQAAEYEVRKTRMEIEINIIDLYSTLLSWSKQKVHLSQSLFVVQQLLEIAERSVQAGIADKLEITSRAIEIEEFKNKISRAEHEIKNILADLSLFTGMSYQDNNLQVSDLSFDSKRLKAMDFKHHPEYQYHRLQHKKKTEEYEITKRQFFPKFDFYARYSFYGSDEDDYFRSYNEIRERNYSIGLHTSIPLVPNLKRRETLARIKMEQNKIKMQMEGTYDAIRSEYVKLKERYAFLRRDIEQKKRLLKLTRQKATMLDRLMKAKAIELKPALEEKLTLIDRKLELERQIVERQAAIKHILIRVEGAV